MLLCFTRIKIDCVVKTTIMSHGFWNLFKTEKHWGRFAIIAEPVTWRFRTTFFVTSPQRCCQVKRVARRVELNGKSTWFEHLPCVSRKSTMSDERKNRRIFGCSTCFLLPDAAKRALVVGQLRWWNWYVFAGRVAFLAACCLCLSSSACRKRNAFDWTALSCAFFFGVRALSIGSSLFAIPPASDRCSKITHALSSHIYRPSFWREIKYSLRLCLTPRPHKT